MYMSIQSIKIRIISKATADRLIPYIRDVTAYTYINL